MSKNFTLDDIRAAADAKYASTTIPVGDVVVELRNALRLPKDVRAELMKLQGDLDKDEKDLEEGEELPDQEEIMRDVIRLVASSRKSADLLLNEVGEDLAILAIIFEKYVGETQPGEASGSQD